MARKKLVKYLFGVGVLFVILLILVITVKVYAQYQFSTDIAERLIQEGVPVKEINTLSHLP
jgi:Na+-transporting methylmalonyl-CoA/oxaloacetate decarboxylase gamma subunit